MAPLTNTTAAIREGDLGQQAIEPVKQARGLAADEGAPGTNHQGKGVRGSGPWKEVWKVILPIKSGLAAPGRHQRQDGTSNAPASNAPWRLAIGIGMPSKANAQGGPPNNWHRRWYTY